MRKLIIALAVTLMVALAAPLAMAQELYSDPFNCAAQGMKVGGGYECAPLDAGVYTPPPANPVIINQGGYDWYYYGPEQGWWYLAEDGNLYPDFR
jgi:hypothetical protein